jgi:tetratricopeptide (TPR) repeat protein
LARDTFKQASGKWPDDLRLVQNYAEASLQLKANADAEKAIRDLIARPAWQGKPDPTMLLADFLGRTGKSADQEKLLRDYLATNSTAVPVQIRLSGMLAQQNKLDEALKILEPNQDVPLIRRQRIELQIAGNRFKEAEEEIQNSLATTPNPGPLLLNRQAFVYMKSGRATQALQVLERVLSQYPNDSEALFYRATVYIAARRNLDQAIRDLLAVRDAPGTEMSGRLLLSQAYHYFGDDESAIRELEDAIRLFPADKSLRLRVVDLYAHSDPPRWAMVEKTLREARNQPQLTNDVELIQAEADMWYQRHDSAKATEAILQAIKVAPSDMNLFRTYCSILLQAKDYRRLMAGTDATIKSSKNPQWWIYDFRGRAQKPMGNTSEAALAEFGKGIEAAQAEKDDAAVATIINSIVEQVGVLPAKMRVMPLAEKGDNRWRLILAHLLETENDITGAIEWTERVMNDPKADPIIADVARQSAATLYLRKSPPDCDRAIAIYIKLLDRDPNDVVALNNIACTMILPNSGHTPKEAMEYSARAFKLVTQSTEVNPYIYDTQGYVLVLNGQAQEGIALLQQAVDKEPIPEACYHLGEAYLALATPRYSDAQDSLKQAMGALDALSKDNKPLDTDLKVKIEAAMERARPPATQNSTGA